MTYVKPGVVLITNAIQVIQGSTEKPPNSALDANLVTNDATSPAYEADE